MQELIDKLPDSVALTGLAKWLRTQPPQVADAVLTRLLTDADSGRRISGLALMRRVQSLRDLAGDKIKLGLARDDPSEIRHWLEAFEKVMGASKLLGELFAVAETNPASLVHVWYQLVPLTLRWDRGLTPRLLQLRDIIEQAAAGFDNELRAYWARQQKAVPLR